MWQRLKGYKTYILTGIGLVLLGLHQYGIINDAMWQTLGGLDVFGIFAALRAATK